ncbi:MAG: transporter associated domain-containing protein, partial [Phycisphaerales bacterium]
RGAAETPSAVRRDSGSSHIDWRQPRPDVRAPLVIARDAPDELPEVATAAGLVTALLGDLPATGDHADWHGWRFEVVDLDGRRVDKLLVSRLPRADRASR